MHAAHGGRLVVPHLQPVRADGRNVAVLQVGHALGGLEQGGNVGGDDAFPRPHADHEGILPAGRHQDVAGGAHRQEGVGAPDLPQGPHDSGPQVSVAMRLDEVGQDLAVRLRPHPVAPVLELLPKLVVVVDVPVMDDGDGPAAVQVGVGVALGGGAHGGPAGVADAEGALQGRDLALELLHEAGVLEDVEAFTVADGDPTGVVAAVLDAVEGVEEDGPGLPGANVADDSAHRGSPRLRVSRARRPAWKGARQVR